MDLLALIGFVTLLGIIGLFIIAYHYDNNV
ncbi:hypothetical protein SPSYN_02536 [Sporotomaculum syntrophicum]|uniref:Uncharacterized protein n=1 Tax=Sporotomaculum syntrophicum TaxID=182264 RepID=A0A9D2WNN0_9FIRM|nr:hypothetical protein SPSYN_02536 [Sporotomaculum syntrophicum]